MTTTFVVRHQGAIDWMKKQNIHVDTWTNMLDLNDVKPGDMVIGILPMHLAAEVCAKGATFIALCIDLPKEFCGQELNGDELEKFSCSLKEVYVELVSS